MALINKGDKIVTMISLVAHHIIGLGTVCGKLWHIYQ